MSPDDIIGLALTFVAVAALIGGLAWADRRAGVK